MVKIIADYIEDEMVLPGLPCFQGLPGFPGILLGIDFSTGTGSLLTLLTTTSYSTTVVT